MNATRPNDLRDKAPGILANITFLLAGYAVGDIIATLQRALA
ncbi:hypothetical protein [Qipengyuania qiaonensis]|nr:hypothetical protein [Qipengyuania qiaonensis]